MVANTVDQDPGFNGNLDPDRATQTGAAPLPRRRAYPRGASRAGNRRRDGARRSARPVALLVVDGSRARRRRVHGGEGRARLAVVYARHGRLADRTAPPLRAAARDALRGRTA